MALAAVLLVGAMLVPAIAAGEWTMFQGNDDHTGLASGSAPTSTPSNWSINVGSSGWAGIDVTPVVDGSKVYTVNYQGKVYAHYISNGTQAWMNDGITGGYAFKLSTPVVDTATSTLYVALNNLTGSNGIILRAINSTDGTEKSHITILSNETGLQANTPITLATFNGYKYVYFGIWKSSSTFHGRYLCYNVSTPTSMTQKWIYYDPAAGSGYYWAGTAVIGNYVVFGNDAGYLTSLNAVSGAQVARLSVPDTFSTNTTSQYIRSTVSYSSTTGMIYFTAENDYCYALGYGSSTGEFDDGSTWKVNIGYSTSTPAISGSGYLYVASGSFTGTGKLTKISASSGTVSWARTNMNGGVQSSPAIYYTGSTDYIYITTNCADGRAYCYNGSGDIIWTYDPPTAKQQYALQGVAISDSKVFFGNDAGWLFCLYM